MFNHLLVPLDGSSLAEGVLRPVARLARGLGLPVTLLRLVSHRAITDGGNLQYRAALDRLVAGEEDEARAYVARQRDWLQSQGVPAVAEVQVVADVPEAILRHAETSGIGLIAMGTHGQTGPAGHDWTLGSVAVQVVYRASVPVLVLRPAQAEVEKPWRSVVVPLDRSPVAEQILPFAEAVVRAQGLPLTLVYVDELPHSRAQWCYADLDEQRQVAARSAAAYLEEKAAVLRQRGVTVATQFRQGVAAPQIIAAAQDRPGSLVAMMTHGRSVLERLMVGTAAATAARQGAMRTHGHLAERASFLGSVAETVARQSGTPVLLARAR